jgi:hypothetical protein
MIHIAHRKNVLFRDGTMFDTFTNLFSGCGGFSHTELVFSDGTSFTSTTTANKDTIFLPSSRTFGPMIRNISYPVWMWELTPLHMSEESEAGIKQWCEKTITESVEDKGGYDWAGIIRFVLPFIKEHKKDWFCTEAVIAALQSAGWFPGLKAWQYSPNKFYRMFKKS